MIARGALGKPEVFAEILNKDIEVDKYQDILFHIDKLCQHYKERYVVLNMRTHIAFYLKKYKISPEIRVQLLSSESLDEVKALLKQIFQGKQVKNKA